MADRRAAPRRNLWRTLVVVGGLLVAVNIFVIGGMREHPNVEPTLPTTIEELIPKPGDLISPQSTIGVNLQDTLTGELELNGQVIPLDQLFIQPTQGIIEFSPGPTKDLTALPQGKNTLVVRYWPRTSTQDKGSTAYSWTFNVGA
jgi:hypothetical protein